MNTILDILNKEPDYSHIVSDMTLSLSLTANECSAVLKSYDYGIDALTTEQLRTLGEVINKLKDKIHP